MANNAHAPIFIAFCCQNRCTSTEVCRLVVTNLRRKSAHALTFGGDFELKFRACANSRRKICDNQPANLCSWQAAKIFNLQHARAQGCNNRGGIPGIIAWQWLLDSV